MKQFFKIFVLCFLCCLLVLSSSACKKEEEDTVPPPAVREEVEHRRLQKAYVFHYEKLVQTVEFRFGDDECTTLNSGEAGFFPYLGTFLYDAESGLLSVKTAKAEELTDGAAETVPLLEFSGEASVARVYDAADPLGLFYDITYDETTGAPTLKGSDGTTSVYSFDAEERHVLLNDTVCYKLDHDNNPITLSQHEYVYNDQGDLSAYFLKDGDQTLLRIAFEYSDEPVCHNWERTLIYGFLDDQKGLHEFPLFWNCK